MHEIVFLKDIILYTPWIVERIGNIHSHMFDICALCAYLSITNPKIN